MPLRVENPRVPAVRAAFERLFRHGDYLAFHDGGRIPWPRYTTDIGNDFGKDNHFQGAQRLHRGAHLVVSGGDPHGRGGSHLFLVRLGSRAARGAWGSNLRFRHVPPDRDVIVQTIGISRKRWHAGGLSVLGDLLAVGIEGRTAAEGSRIVFFSLRDPEDPRQFPFSVVRKRKKAGAVALTRLDNGYLLLAVLTGRTLDCYLSRGTSVFAGFHDRPVTWRAEALTDGGAGDRNFGEYQTINFVTQEDGRLFLVGLHNTSPAAPIVPGRDFVDLFSVAFPSSVLRATPQLDRPDIAKVGKRQVSCPNGQCNMDGAAGVHVSDAGQLIVYATFHWRLDGVVRFNEFREETPRHAPAIVKPGDGWIDLFEHTRFAGRRLSIIGRKDAAIRHYGEIAVQGAAFEDLVSSARWQLPRGRRYILYSGRRYSGRTLVLKGTGRVEEIRNMGRISRGRRSIDFNDVVSSSRYA